VLSHSGPSREELRVRVTLTVSGGGAAPGVQERELGRWLGEAEQLRGRIRVVEGRRQSGALTESLVTVAAEVGPAALTAFATALIAWIRHRTADTRVVVRRPDGARWEISARRVRGLAATEVQALVEQLTRAVDDGAGGAAAVDS
jgi:Effector Associated Constant Component 1